MHKTKREVLKFKDELSHYGEYLHDFEQAEYLMRANDKLIIQNYRQVFSSCLSEKLRKPEFKSAKNTDFYDTMMADGAFIQLGSFFFNPQTTSTAAAIVKSTEDYESSQKIELGKTSTLETLEDNVAIYVTKISE